MEKKSVRKKVSKKKPSVEIKLNDLDCCNSKKNANYAHSKGGFFYFLGFLGSAIYYISTATSFGSGVLGFLKAIVWPAFLVFDLLKFLAA